MLQKLILKNFQKHRHLKIEFDPLCLSVTGASDQGKSACIRALRWLCTNKPSGDSFITHGEDSCSVILYLDNHKIQRIKEKGENTYFLDGGEYKAFGTSVPEEIQKILNLDEQINFQGQLDPPFWFLKTPGEVSKELNKIINLERIDEILSLASSEVRKAKATLEVTEERLTQARKEEKSLAWVEQAHQEYECIQSQEESIASQRSRIASLESCLEEATFLATRLQTLQKASQEARKLLTMIQSYLEANTKKERLEEVLKEVMTCQSNVSTLTKQRKVLHQQVQEQMKNTCPLCGKPG